MSAPVPPQFLRRACLALSVVGALLLLSFAAPAAADAAFPITVNNTRDEVDTNPGNGECRTFSGAGQCSLRAAIQEANASLGADTIYILPGVYELEVPTLNEDLPETGDYDIHGSLTIAKASGPGVPAGDVIIDGGFPPENNAEAVGLDRLFEIHPTALRVTFSNVTLREGYVDGDGAAIQNWSSGIVRVENSKVLKNLATGAGGGINNADPFDYDWLPTDPIPMPQSGRIDIVNSTLSGNGSGARGAAVNNTSSGTVTIAGSSVTDNPGQMIVDPASITLIPDPANPGQLIPDPTEEPEMIPAPGVYEPDSPPIANQGQYDGLGTIRITDSVLSDNYSEHDGGAVAHEGDGALVVEDSEIKDNTSEASGGGIYSHGGTLTVTDSALSGNEAAAGGGILNDGDGHMTLTDVTLGANKAGDDGGGLNNQGRATLVATRVKFLNNEAHNEGGGAWSASERLATIRDSTFSGNKGGVPDLTDPADPLPVGVPGEARFSTVGNVAGGGIYNSSSNPFFILDTHVEQNHAQDGGGLANAPDNDLIVRGSLFLRNVARHPGISEDGDQEEGGHGGAIFSLADGDSMVENTTLSGNSAATAGGGVFHDADGELKLTNLTIWGNSAPQGGGIGVAESDFVPEIPPKANVAVLVRNSIVGGSRNGGSCDWYVTSHGGNMDTGGTQDPIPVEGQSLSRQNRCFLNAIGGSDSGTAPRRDRFSRHFTIDAIAPCPETDQRGVTRPQNGRCDMGAFEFEGPPPPEDDVPPDTVYLTGPIQNTEETVEYTFTGSDNQTEVRDLNYECRVLEIDHFEEPEPLAPWDPVPPEEQWVGCTSPFQGLVLEEGGAEFQVRAIDRADNTDPTPDVHVIPMPDEPPDTIIEEGPPAISSARNATFTFSARERHTALGEPLAPELKFAEFECRLDSRDPELWLECFNPAIFNNLTSGVHTLEVRATAESVDAPDPTPARYTWTVGQ